MDKYGDIALGVECAWPWLGRAAEAQTVVRKRPGFLARLRAGLARLG